MSYTFKPLSDEEIENGNLIEEGIYDFVVVKAERLTSKSGNPMAKLNLKVWDKNGVPRFINDFLIFSDKPLNIKKIKHFCYAVGLEKDYHLGVLSESMDGLKGKAEVKIIEGNIIPDDRLAGKPRGSKYPNQNVIYDYILRANQNSSYKSDLNDDLPF